MLIAQGDRTARDLMRRVVPVREDDLAVKALKTLQSEGMAVLVDSEERPIDILTMKNFDDVRSRAESLTSETKAKDLFSPEKRRVVSVKIGDDLAAIIDKIATNGLWPGVIVVDDRDRYAGYVFSDDLRKKAEENAKLVQQMYPEAWANVGAPLVTK